MAIYHPKHITIERSQGIQETRQAYDQQDASTSQQSKDDISTGPVCYFASAETHRKPMESLIVVG